MRFVFLGDVMLGRLVNEHLATAPPEYPWGDTLSLLRSADALFINLECVLADRGDPWPQKMFTFRSDAKNVAVLQTARVTAASLANNHALDYGAEALLECCATLRAHGICPAGAGPSIDAAREPAACAVGEVRVAFVAFTDDVPAWEAGPAAPGIFHVPLTVPPKTESPRLGGLLRIIEDAKRRSDIVIVSAHWGPNWGAAPLAEHVDAAHLLVERGADVVFGHSSHIVRGVEIYRDRPILYSCGDYVDDYAVDDVQRNDQACIFCLDYDRDRLRQVLLIPTLIARGQARRAGGAERGKILRKVQALCARLGTAAHEVPEGLRIAP
ncbi:MAG TPA: CapA family protein [bacterium]|nr:CapA family protein [bacterium]